MKNNLAFLGLFLLASCSAETGGDAPPVDAAPDIAAPELDAGSDASVQEAGAEADVQVERPNWWEDDSRIQRYDGPADSGGSGNLFDARGPDGQCFIPPALERPWLSDVDPDTGLVTCNYPPGTWQHIVCDCIIDTYFPDAGYDRDR
jgi:hypothetical protein